MIVDHDVMVRRILEHWHAATAADLATGLGWYGRAEQLADALQAGAPITRAQAAGCIAALSPRCGWSTNVRAAVKMVDARKKGALDAPVVAGFNGNAAKAWAILHHREPLDILGGPKVRAFYSNIMGDADAVTVDTWAARAAEGPDYGGNMHIDGKRYAAIADAYRAVADLVGHSPRDVQAAVWTQIRRTQARAIFDLKERS